MFLDLIVAVMQNSHVFLVVFGFLQSPQAKVELFHKEWLNY